MSTFIYSVNSEAHPAPTMQQRFNTFQEQWGKAEGFAYLVTQWAKSLTVATAKKVGATLAFPTQMISMKWEMQLSQEHVELIERINTTAQILGTTGVKQIN